MASTLLLPTCWSIKDYAVSSEFVYIQQDAVVIILDVGPSMCQAPPGHSTSLEISVKAINMIIQRKVHVRVASWTPVYDTGCRLHLGLNSTLTG